MTTREVIRQQRERLALAFGARAENVTPAKTPAPAAATNAPAAATATIAAPRAKAAAISLTMPHLRNGRD